MSCIPSQINIGFFIMATVIMRKHQHKRKDSGKISSIRYETPTYHTSESITSYNIIIDL